MAISFVAATSIATTTTGSIDLGIPVGYAEGDFLIIIITSSAIPIPTPTTVGSPGNWTSYQYATTGQNTTVFTKKARASEGPVPITGLGASAKLVMLAYRGVGYVDIAAGTTSGTGTSATTLSGTTLYNNDYVLSIYACAPSATATWTSAPASTTNRVLSNPTSTFKGLLISDELQVNAGATAVRFAALSSSLGWQSIRMTLKEPTIFYVDPETGNDGNSGRTRALALKNFSAATTAKGVVAGDTVRFKETPVYNTGVNATWLSPQQRGINPFATHLITGAAGVTNTTPIVVSTTLPHGYSTGDVVMIANGTGNTAVNGVFKITQISSTSFSLNDSSGNGTYLSNSASIFPVFCRTIVTSSPLVKPLASFAPVKTVSLGTRLAWANATTNVAVALTPGFAKGAYIDQISPNAVFTTGKIAYYTLPAEVNLSSYQQLSLYISQAAGTLGGLTISLCNDTLGNTPVNSFTIPSTGALNVWCPFTLNNGSALGSTIRSIAISRSSNLGAQTFQFNSIVACKAPTDVDAVSNTSLITKNNGTEGAYSVGGFCGSDGSIIFLSSNPTGANNTSTAGAYYGTSETVPLHRIQPFNPFTLNGAALPSSGTATNSYLAAPNPTGVFDNNVIYSGGWDTVNMSSRTGSTWFTNQNGFGRGIFYSSGGGFTTIDRINYTNVYQGVSIQTGATGNKITNCNYTATANRGIDLASSNQGLLIENCIITNTNQFGIGASYGSTSYLQPMVINNCTISGTSGENISINEQQTIPYTSVTNCTLNTAAGTSALSWKNSMFGQIKDCAINYYNASAINASSGIRGPGVENLTIVQKPGLNGVSHITLIASNGSNVNAANTFTTFRNVTVLPPTTLFSQGNSTIGKYVDGAGNCKFYNCTFTANGTTIPTQAVTLRDYGPIYFYNCSPLGGSAFYSASVMQPFLLNVAAYSQDENNIIGNNKIYFSGGLATAQTAVRNTPTGYAWSMAPTDTTATTSLYPMKLKIASIACNGGKDIIVSAWMRRTNTGLTMQLVCPGGQPYGPYYDAISSMTVGADTWQKVSIYFSVENNAVIDIYAYAYGGTTFTGYVHDLEVIEEEPA
jgi:hypothetical protein